MRWDIIVHWSVQRKSQVLSLLDRARSCAARLTHTHEGNKLDIGRYIFEQKIFNICRRTVYMETLELCNHTN